MKRAGVLLGGVLAMFAIATSAEAATTGPTAVTQDSKGVSYAGFASGTTLQRIDASGAVLSSIPLDQTGAVSALAVDAADNIWVDYGTSVSRLTPTGAVLTHFTICGGQNLDPVSYGGIAIGQDSTTRDSVFVGCGASIQEYSLAGTLAFTVSSPGGTVHGLAWLPQKNGKGAQLFAGLDSGKVAQYAAPFTAGEQASQPVLTLATPSGGSAPKPSGVAVDVYGQLFVLDQANNQITLYDTNNGNSAYRTIGHGPAAGSDAGSFSAPNAIALHGQDGGDLAGNVFVADTGNNRVQRLNSYGYSFWATSTSGGGTAPPISAPVNTSVPKITGTPTVGQTLTCSDGTWSGNPTSYNRGWNRDGSYLPGVNGTTYTLTSADAGHQISCFVQAVNAAGPGGYATSAPVTVAAAGASAPVNSSAPTITGTSTTGSTLTCNPGTWSGAPTFAYKFLRDSGATVVSQTSTYKLVAADVGHAITCMVTATNGAGSSTATSAPVTPTAPATCTGRTGVSINGAALVTNNQAVTLTIRPPAGATSVTISNDGGFDTVTTSALAGSCSYAWTLPTTGSDRLPKTVYVRFSGGSVNGDQTFSDDIVLDKTPPSTSSATVSKGAVVSRTTATAAASRWTLSLKAKDVNSGLGKVQYASRKGAKGKTVAYHAKLRVGSPSLARWMRVFDKAGNPSKWRKVTRR